MHAGKYKYSYSYYSALQSVDGLSVVAQLSSQSPWTDARGALSATKPRIGSAPRRPMARLPCLCRPWAALGASALAFGLMGRKYSRVSVPVGQPTTPRTPSSSDYLTYLGR